MKVAFLGRDPKMASTRYRTILPAMALHNMGVEITKDAEILVFSKDKVDAEILKLYPKTVYDVCDDNLDCAKRGEEYRRHIATASAVTCNSDAMRWVIHKKCNRVATVIPDPYEHEEWKPSFGEGLLWYGHQVNLKDLVRVRPTLEGHEIRVISAENQAGIPYIPWSPEAMDAGFKECALVIIPTGRGVTKSANRLIEAVRAGKFVVTEPLPAYEEFSRWMYVGELRKGVNWALANRDEALARVKSCQAYLRNTYSPERIGGLWLQVLRSV